MAFPSWYCGSLAKWTFRDSLFHRLVYVENFLDDFLLHMDALVNASFPLRPSDAPRLEDIVATGCC
jgi:hypothetical protein